MRNTEPAYTRWNHTPATWEKRKVFADLLGKACIQKNIQLTWLDDEKWTGVIENTQGRQAPIYGYDLGLNSSAAAKVSDSKADTYALLTHNKIPAVPHVRIAPHMTDGSKVGPAVLAEAAITTIGTPLVAKPDALASGGAGVVLCDSDEQVKKAINNGSVMAVSPYIEFDEYRVIVLDGESRGVIKKMKEPNGWMHNHSKGAEHTLVQPDSNLYDRLGSLGTAATTALNLRFATVDIADTQHDALGLSVLEVNESVSIVYPNVPDLEMLAHEVYGDAAEARLGVNTY